MRQHIITSWHGLILLSGDSAQNNNQSVDKVGLNLEQVSFFDYKVWADNESTVIIKVHLHAKEAEVHCQKMLFVFQQQEFSSTQPKYVPVAEKQYIFITGIIVLKKSHSWSHSVSPQTEEDVTYASVVHSTEKRSRRPQKPSDDGCEYAMVQVPAAPRRGSAASSTNDCEEDYVLMG